jgi:maleylacetoacetate isomerase/maleylpyruvate isomerase
MKLYNFWRSLAAFRVRIALKLKRLDFDVISTDLLKGEQFETNFIGLNPQGMVPALVLDDGEILTQSMAILEYLDEVYPTPPLLPQDPLARARVRNICMITVADTHPLVVPRVRKYIGEELGLDDPTLEAWIANWTQLGLAAIEARIASHNPDGLYCEGSDITMADLCVVPQVGAALMFGVALEPYPNTSRVFEACMDLSEFFDSRPQVQPDYPGDAS